jgi:hypothetical protein
MSRAAAVLDALGVGRASDARGGWGAGCYEAWSRGDFGEGGVWHENARFRSLCRSGQLYVVLLQLFCVSIGEGGGLEGQVGDEGVGGGSRAGGGGGRAFEEVDACKRRLVCVCEVLQRRGVRVDTRVEPSQVRDVC